MSGLSSEIVICGGGVVGLAIARALAEAGREVLLLEAADRIGDETSSRNNQVVHAGFLYPVGSLKSALCKPGRDALLAYCRARDVPHRILPKLMPALSEDELPILQTLVAQGRAVQVDDLEILGPAELARLEPGMKAAGALLSPSTGIVDAPSLVQALERDAVAAGAMVARRTEALSIACDGVLRTVTARDPGGDEITVEASWIVNAAGLGARALALSTSGLPRAAVPDIHHAKGQFLSYRGPTGFRHLVVPVGPALTDGGALTLDLAEQARFGPDLSFVEGRDYALTTGVPPGAAEAIRSWWPGLDSSRLAPEFAGIRPRVTGPCNTPGDWRIDGPDRHGLPGMIHLFGIDTPGLTACLALADHVHTLVDRPAPH